MVLINTYKTSKNVSIDKDSEKGFALLPYWITNSTQIDNRVTLTFIYVMLI